MDVLIRFQLNNRQLAITLRGQHDEHGAVGSGKSRHLRIEATWIEALVERTDIAHHQRFQPALRMQPVKSVMPTALQAALRAQALHQRGKFTGRARVENTLFGANAKHDLLQSSERA